MASTIGELLSENYAFAREEFIDLAMETKRTTISEQMRTMTYDFSDQRKKL